MSKPRVALISSGAGYTTRGVETWMADLAIQLPRDLDLELWTGGPPPPVPRTSRRYWSLDREHRMLRGRPWGRRYLIEQWTMLPRLLVGLRRHGRTLAYCGDPVVTWHLKRFQRLHGAAVVFMNGMRLSPGWARHLDGVHLLATPYLEQARREVSAADAERFFAVPHFTDVDRFRPPTPDERAAARAEFQLPESSLLVLTLGPIGHTSGKRLEHLAAEIAGCPGAVLVHAGGEEDGAAEVRAATDLALGTRVRWLGKVPRDRVERLFRGVDVYSLGSLAEPFSIAILEALSSGLPVVHHADTVMTWQTGGGGCPVAMDQRGGAVAAFVRLAQDPAHRLALGAAGRSLALSRYAPGPVCADLVAALRSVRVRPSRP